MKSVAILFAGFLLAGSAAYAQQLSAGSADLLTSVPPTASVPMPAFKGACAICSRAADPPTMVAGTIS